MLYTCRLAAFEPPYKIFEVKAHSLHEYSTIGKKGPAWLYLISCRQALVLMSWCPCCMKWRFPQTARIHDSPPSGSIRWTQFPKSLTFSNSHNKNIYRQQLFIISEWWIGEKRYYQFKIREHLERDSTGLCIIPWQLYYTCGFFFGPSYDKCQTTPHSRGIVLLHWSRWIHHYAFSSLAQVSTIVLQNHRNSLVFCG